MVNAVVRIIMLSLVVVAGTVGVWKYYDHRSAARQIQVLEEDKRLLEKVVQNLTAEKRVAEVLVIDRQLVAEEPQTTLLFVESDAHGNALSPKSFTIRGKIAHVEALVIRFDRDFVKAGDPLKGHSVALFTKIYGEKQKPEDGQPIDPPEQVPEIYRSKDAQVTAYEQSLWKDFWKLLEDEKFRQEKGVRIAQGEALWWPPEDGKLYTISVESDGGLILTSRPVPAVYQEALKRGPR